MKTQEQSVCASDNFGVQILGKIRSFISALRTNSHFLNLCAWTLEVLRLPRTLAEVMARVLAPLRRIVSRDLEVIAFGHNSEVPQSFLIHDTLECGHVGTSPSWDVFDLLNAYTDNPEVKARRHRCRPCASLLAHKKPVQAVGLVAKVEVA